MPLDHDREREGGREGKRMGMRARERKKEREREGKTGKVEGQIILVKMTIWALTLYLPV